VGEGGKRAEAGSFVAAPVDRALPLRFDDGTRVSLAAGTSARVASLDGHGAHIVIEKGRAVASVVHRPDSRWRVDVGPFQVAVVGTRFDVSWDASARVLELRLDEGAVLVSGGLLSDSLRVQAGQRLRAFADDARVELSGAETSRAPLAAPAASSEVASGVEAAAPALARSVAAPAVTWQSLASAGKFREAVAAAERSGFEQECARASGQDLLMLGDAARLAGAAARAEQAYTAARGKLPGGGRASYGLGLVAFDQRSDYAGAARWFQTYLREQPGGSLRAEAMGRLLESLHRSGRKQEAQKLADQYLGRYPNGAQAPLARQLVR
jgi:TolA-binding protein